MFQFKDEKISKSERYGYLFSNYDIEKEYPGFLINRYMLPSVKKMDSRGCRNGWMLFVKVMSQIVVCGA
jgi:hypothetical protein